MYYICKMYADTQSCIRKINDWKLVMATSAYYPVTYMRKLVWNNDIKQEICDFVKAIPKNCFKGPSNKDYDQRRKGIVDTSHPYYGYLWTCNDNNKGPWGDYDLLSCPAIKKLADQIGERTYYHIMVKWTNKGLRMPFKPVMQSAELDQQEGFEIERLWDIICPLQGNFDESPFEVLDSRTNTLYPAIPKGIPMLLPIEPWWHHSWEETREDARITLHFRGCAPVTYDAVASKLG